MNSLAVLVLAAACGLGVARDAVAQASMGAPVAPRPWGRISFYMNVSHTDVDGTPGAGFGELTSAFTFQAPDLPGDGVDYGVDVRHSGYSGTAIPSRMSVYEGFVGGRMSNGAVRARAGYLWLTDLGSLGSVAGAAVEVRQDERKMSGVGRLRVGGFYGLEPNILETGYAPDVTKFGVYAALDGERARRHVLGFVTLHNASLTERSVLTTTNFVPVGQRFFLYQALEYDMQAPAGQGSPGLTYFFTNARVSPTSRFDLQGNYNRGRSVDARGIAEDVLNGRPLNPAAVEGLLYETLGGRATVEVAPRVRLYAGYSRDKNNRDDVSTGRTIVGGYAGNIMNSGVDVSGSDSLNDAPDRSYHSLYVSVGKQIGGAVYVSGDYSNSLSLIRFSRSDGIVIEQKPQTHRFSGTSVINLKRGISVMVTIDRSLDDSSRELRLLSGITYRFQ